MANGLTPNGAQELMEEDTSFLNSFAGQGFENMNSSALSTAYLTFVQPDSSAESADNPAGTWRNSATGRSYGNTARVIALAFKTIWSEREAEPPFRTVGRYEPNSIEIELRQPPKGKRGYPKMINPDSGNEVQELYVYAVILPDYPEDGVLYFSPTVSSMKTCRSWNSQLHSQILPNGAQAPLFAYSWNLTAGLVPNPQQPTKNIAKFTSASRDVICTADLFKTVVQPQLAGAKQTVLQITSDVEDTAE